MNIQEIIKKWPRHIVLGGNDITGGLEQNAYELEMLCNFIIKNKIKTYVEVGIAAGLLLRFMRDEMFLDVKGITLEPRNTHEGLPVVYGKSQDKSIIDSAIKADFYFIDGDHSYEYVKQDYENYKHLCKYMGFHDILGQRDCEGVNKLWNEIKNSHKNWEFIDSDLNIASGIGIIKINN
jgi:hypothetical protein